MKKMSEFVKEIKEGPNCKFNRSMKLEIREYFKNSVYYIYTENNEALLIPRHQSEYLGSKSLEEAQNLIYGIQKHIFKGFDHALDWSKDEKYIILYPIPHDC
jgi:hypothetical protein